MANGDWKGEVKHKEVTTEVEDRFIFDQAEKKLKELLASSDLVVARSTTLITLIVGLLVGLTSFSVNRYNTILKNDAFVSMSLFGVLYLLAVVWYISYNIRGIDHSSIGASPELLFSGDFFTITKDANLRYKMMVWSQIENYQDSIDINRPINEKKWYRFNLTLKLLIATPIILLIAFYVIRFLWF